MKHKHRWAYATYINMDTGDPLSRRIVKGIVFGQEYDILCICTKCYDVEWRPYLEGPNAKAKDVAR